MPPRLPPLVLLTPEEFGGLESTLFHASNTHIADTKNTKLERN